MNTRKIAKEYRLSHWAQVLRERKESGLSIKAFCESAGFHENVYFYWQRKLREASCQEKAAGAVMAIAPNGWAVCETEKAKSEKGSVIIEIGQYRVTVTNDVDPELLTKVCRMLMAL